MTAPVDVQVASLKNSRAAARLWRRFESLSAPGISTLFLLALTLGAVSAGFAALEARDLDADGALYLLGALSRGGLAFFEPARKTVHLLQQSFVYAGYQLGVTDLLMYGRLLTLGMQLWPLLLTGLAWFVLPGREKQWIVGPLLNLAVVIPTTSFFGVGEGIIASCLMWLLYFLVEFRIQGWFTGFLALALAAVCYSLHEAAFLFLGGIAVLSLGRARSARGVLRLCLCLVALAAIASSVHLFHLVIVSRDAGERGAYLLGLVGEFLVSPDGPGVNLPAVAAIAFGLCLLAAHFPRGLADWQRRRRLVATCKIAGSVFALIAVLFICTPEWVITPHVYFAARGLPIIATTAMAAAIHMLRRACWTADRLMPAPVRTLLAGLVALQFLIQTVMTEHWTFFRRDLANLVAAHAGIVDWKTASATLNPHHTFFRGHFVRAWSIQPLSIVLAPQGRLSAIVDARPDAAWKAFRLDDPSTLPLCIGMLDWSRYLAALRDSGADLSAHSNRNRWYCKRESPTLP